MTDQDLIIRLRQRIGSLDIASPVMSELIDICEAEIAIAYEWATSPPGATPVGEGMAISARSQLARSILRVIAKGYSIDWTKST